MHPRENLFYLERLRDVIVRTDQERCDGVESIGTRARHQEDGDGVSEFLAQCPAELISALLGKDNLGDDDGGLFLVRELDGFSGCRGRIRAVAVAGERRNQPFAALAVVVHDEDGHIVEGCHLSLPYLPRSSPISRSFVLQRLQTCLPVNGVVSGPSTACLSTVRPTRPLRCSCARNRHNRLQEDLRAGRLRCGFPQSMRTGRKTSDPGITDARAGPSPERKSAASATMIVYGTSVAVAVLSLLSVLIVSRVHGPTGRGHVAFLTAITGFTSFLVSAGIEEANANFGASEPESRRALASNSIILSLLLGAFAAVAVDGLIHAVPAVGGGAPNGLRLLSLGLLPVLILNLYLRWLVRADYAFAITNVALLVTPLGNVLANGVLAFLGLLTVTTAVVAWLAGQAISTIVLAWYVARRLTGFGLPDLRLMRRTLAFGLKTHAGRVMLLGNYRLDPWILGAISGARELGLYSVAVAWAEALWDLSTALKFVQRPFLVRSGRTDAVRQAAAGFRAATLATIGLGLAMVAIAPFLCVTIFGEKFRGSIVELRILVIG